MATNEHGYFTRSRAQRKREREADEELQNNKRRRMEQATAEAEETCSICLGELRNKELGCPEFCRHHFCLECLETWTEYNNTCPVDRQTIENIAVRDTIDGIVKRTIAVPEPAAPEEPDDYDSILLALYDELRDFDEGSFRVGFDLFEDGDDFFPCDDSLLLFPFI